MKILFQIIISCLFFICTFQLSVASPGDVIYISSAIKVTQSQNSNSRVIAQLREGFMVLKVRDFDSGVFQVVLTDGKTGYIPKSATYESTPDYILPGNTGLVSNLTNLKSQPSNNSSDIANLGYNIAFLVTDIYPYGDYWVQVRLISGPDRGKHGYILLSDVVFRCVAIESHNVYKKYFKIPDGFFNFFNNGCTQQDEPQYFTPSLLPGSIRTRYSFNPIKTISHNSFLQESSSQIPLSSQSNFNNSINANDINNINIDTDDQEVGDFLKALESIIGQ